MPRSLRYNNEKQGGGDGMSLVDDRRALHQIPELDRNLPKTMEYLKNALQGLR